MKPELIPDEGADRPFVIRPYRKAEFAQLYFPDLTPRCALRKLHRWIERSDALRRTLYEEGPEGRNEQTFSRRQVELLVRHFDEP
jgi:hypothetical protein